MAPDWILCVLVPLAMAFFAWRLYRMRKNKENDKQVSYRVYRENVVVHVPISIDPSAGDDIADDVSDAITVVWYKMGELYKTSIVNGITEVIVMETPIYEEHPYVVWHLGSNKIWVLHKDDMIKWLMLELHNVFRYGIHKSYGAIYKPVSDEDRLNALAVQDYINNNWSE